MKKRKAYAGVLLRPVVAPPFKHTLLSPGLAEPDWRQNILDQWEERWVALFDHYGIEIVDERSFKILAAALAKDWVPGFAFAPEAPAKRRGAPTGKGFETNKQVFIAVETLRRKRPKLSIAQACARLTRALNADAKSIRNRYEAFVHHYCAAAPSDRLRELMKQALAAHLLSN